MLLGSGLNFVTTVVGFGMSAAFIFFICVRLICGQIRSSDPQAATLETDLRSALDMPEHIIHGLEPVVVAEIPTTRFCNEAFHSKDDAQCSICLGEYQDKEVLRVMPICYHNFHLNCIDLWLQKHSTCPICRLPLNTKETRIASLFESSLQVRQAEFPGSQVWLLPMHQHSGSSNNLEIYGAVSSASRDLHGEHGHR